MSMEVRIVKRLSKSFTLELDLHKGEGGLGLIGPSGSGKSMTLKCIAGVETPDEGYIAVDGRVLFDSAAGVNIKPRDRRVGYMFQEYALFPHMTVAQNIACAIPREKRGSLPALIARFGLEGLEHSLPRRLSGGQQQRVALARMLAREPEFILLDEPLSALDPHLREQVQRELLHTLADCRDFILVTHDRGEAYRFCPALALIEQGRLLASGPAGDLFANPETVRAARLTGCKNLSRATLNGDGMVTAADWGISLRIPAPPPDMTWVGIRAHALRPCYGDPGGADNAFPVRVVEQWEDLFEWNYLCVPILADGAARGVPLWLKLPKSECLGPPAYLIAPPDALLLLRGEE